MRKIFKYEVGIKCSIDIPVGAKILSVHCQNDSVFFWAEVDTRTEVMTRNFEIFGTGHEIPYRMGVDYDFIGTAHMSTGLVWHLFERLGL